MPRYAKVEQPKVFVFRNHDVVWFHITVDNPSLLGFCESLKNVKTKS
jgi:hypothetical protein